MKGNIVGLPEESRNLWSAKQTYIALETLNNCGWIEN
jgi:hypothetical protein